MTRNYNLSHRLIAHILLFSLFLQSCGNSIMSSDNVQKVEQVYNEEASTSEERDDKSKSLFGLQQDHQITVYQQEVKEDYIARGALLKSTGDENNELCYQSEREGKKDWLDEITSQKHLLAIPLVCATKCIKSFNRNTIGPFYLSTHSKNHSLWKARQSITREKSRFLAFKSEAILPYSRSESSFFLMQRLNAPRLFEKQYREKDSVQSWFRLPQVTSIVLGMGGIELVVEDKTEKQEEEKDAMYQKETNQQFTYYSKVKSRLYNPLEQSQKEPAINQGFWKTLEALKNNDPHVKIVDLKQEKLSRKDFEHLKQAVDNNFVLGYIHWGEVPADCQELKEEIDKKLVQNICSYTYYPSDYVHGLLAQHIYSDPKEGEEVNFKDLCQKLAEKSNQELIIEPPKEVSPGWKVKQVKDDTKDSGFFSALYVNESTHQAVLSFQGTYTDTIDRIVKDLAKEDMQGVLGNAITRQQALAYEETKAAVEYVKKEGLNLSFTGHSLGGYLAELGIAFCYLDFDYRQVKAIVFDSPGTDKKLDTFQLNVINPSTEFDIKHLPITAYLSAPNLVNVCNGHVGEVYRVYPDLQWEGWFSKWDKLSSNLPSLGATIETINKGLRATIPGHYLYIMLSLFDANTGKPKEYVRIKDWPKLNKDAVKYVGKQSTSTVLGDALGSSIAGPIGGLIGRCIGAIMLGGLGAPGSVASVLLDCRNIDQTQLWATHSYLDKDYREINLEPIEEFKHKYVGHYRVSPISIEIHPLYMDGYESIDGFLHALWEDREDINKLDTNDITGTVLKNILQDYSIVNKEDNPCLQLKQNPRQVQVLRDKMQRAKDTLTSTRIKEALKHSKNQAVVKYVVQEFSKQLQEKTIKQLSKLHSYISVAKPQHYVHRKSKEEELSQKLNEKGICVIRGHGGVGKSTLAAEYGYTLKDKQTVCWTQAETEDKLRTSYENAAKEMGINGERLEQLKEEFSSNYLEILAREVYNKLVDNQQPVLLILDNATDPNLIETCLRHRPNELVQVIITTRNKKSFEDYGEVQLDAFTLEEGKAYIQHRLQSLNPGKPDIQALIKEVGLIPKKLELATAYISDIHFMSIQKYIEKLQELKKQHTRQQGKLVLPEVNLGLETLDPPAQLLMRYGAYLNPDFIPSSLVTKLLAVSDEEELGALLTPLEKLSLITVTNDSRQVGIQIHREVQAACKEYTKWEGGGEDGKDGIATSLTEQAVLETLLKSLAEYMPKVTEIPNETWRQANLYATNVTYVLTNVIKRGIVDPLLADLINRMGNYNRYISYNYKKSLEYYEQALKIRQALYKGNHPDIAESLNNIGCVYKDGLGQAQEALNYFERALEMYNQIYEQKNHPDIARILSNLGITNSSLSRLEKALNYHQQALEMSKILYGDNNPNIAKLLNNLGAFYNDNLGQPQEALNYFKKALRMHKQVYKQENHPDIATTLGSLGVVYSALGKPTKALKYYQQALEMSKILYGDNNPNIAKLLNNLGAFYNDNLGQPQEALNYFKKALRMHKQVYKQENHPDIATTLGSLGVVYSALGKPTKALKYYQQTLEMNKILYGDNNPNVAKSLNDLGTFYNDNLDQPQEALNYFKQALEMYKQTYEQKKHPGIAITLNNLGIVYSALGKPTKALKYYQQALEMRQALYTGNHPHIANSLYSIGHMYHSLDKFKEALEWYQKAADQGHKCAQHDLGWMYQNGQGVDQNYQEAFKWYQKAVNQGDATAQNNLGFVYENGLGIAQDYQEAVKWYKKATDQGDEYGKANLGRMYYHGTGIEKNIEEASKLFNEVAKYFEEEAEKDLLDLDGWYILGWMYQHGQGVPLNYQESIKSYQKAANQGFAAAQYKLGTMYYSGNGIKQDYEEALKWFQKAADQDDINAQANVKELTKLLGK